MIEEKLLWEKNRPNDYDEIVLLPRIKKIIDAGISSNLILYGPFGTGKTSLAKLLTKGKSVLYFNTSLHTSIDNLREDIQKHVDTLSLFESNDGFKYVFLDECEQASNAYQNALKAFIEEYSAKVRFIFVTNHIHKVDPGIISRCTKLDFTPLTSDEIKWWKNSCAKKLKEIAEENNIEINKEDLIKIVNHNYPDLRQMTEVLSNISLTGRIDYSITIFDNDLKNNLYDLLSNNSSVVDLQSFVMEYFGPEKVQELFNLCGRPLMEILILKEKTMLVGTGLAEIYSLVAEHSMWLSTIKGGDPVVVGVSLLHKIQNLIKK